MTEQKQVCDHCVTPIDGEPIRVDFEQFCSEDCAKNALNEWAETSHFNVSVGGGCSPDDAIADLHETMIREGWLQ
jgi:endogenous inhibitor of DNA gyrase (YacG/DUF329 family)